jgi:single-strand DNA-binding protein
MGKIKIPRINEVTISGRVTRDPELKYTPGGAAVVRISVACDRSYKDKAGTWQTETIFVPVQAWAATAEGFCKNATKGSPVIVKGRLSITKWQDANGNNKELTEIVAERIDILEWKDDNGSASGNTSEPPFGAPPSGDVPF